MLNPAASRLGGRRRPPGSRKTQSPPAPRRSLARSGGPRPPPRLWPLVFFFFYRVGQDKQAERRARGGSSSIPFRSRVTADYRRRQRGRAPSQSARSDPSHPCSRAQLPAFGIPMGLAHRVIDIDARHLVGAGQQRGLRGQLGQPGRSAPCELAHVPEAEPAPEPAQRGRGPHPPTRPIAPCRSRSISSMVSAPATIPATTDRPPSQPSSRRGHRSTSTARPDQPSQATPSRAPAPSPAPTRHTTPGSGHRNEPSGCERVSLRRCPS